ncbi:alpha/beta hydrolase [Aurantivibrio plasticivorans]
MTYNYDPELLPYVKGIKDNPMDDPVEARVTFEAMIKANVPPANVEGLFVEDHSVPGFDGAPPVTVRVYKPQTPHEQPGPALLHIHGGGFVIGSIDADHATAASFARGLNCVVVSVEYRLAPENPYPAPLHDCYAAMLWMRSSAAESYIDPTRIAVNGVSAGGGLASALTLFMRERGDDPLCFQLLNIPEVDDRLQTPSATQFIDTPIWNRPKAKVSWTYHLGDLERGSDDVPPTAAPARAKDLTGLPPAYICVMEFDPLRDEGIAYASQLMKDGVSVELHSYPGTFHGSAMFPVAVSKRQFHEMLQALKKGLGITL